jgi:predicted HicB family RNase H-like nuclease
MILFHLKGVQELKKSFEQAVDDYIILCRENGRTIEKSYKGSFNVRFPPDIHKKAKRIALMKGISLNQLIQKAVEEEVERELEVLQ